MRRFTILTALVVTVLVGTGCKSNITGTHDCTYDPASATLPVLDGKPSVVTVGSPIR